MQLQRITTSSRNCLSRGDPCAGDATFAVYMVILLPVILAVGTAYFVLVERPCMDPEWPFKLARKLRGGTSGELAAEG